MYNDIIKFWFEDIEKSQWWIKDSAFDRLIAETFGDVHASAAQCELYEWRATPKGRLAEIIVLDQFSRNMYRDQAASFANDPLALALAQAAIADQADSELSTTERSFLYMPFMHSESLKIHEVAVTLFESDGMESNLAFELKHKKIIERFGRYPHRNKILGRKSTAEEEEFLTQPGSSF